MPLRRPSDGLTDDEGLRSPERDVEITDVRTMGIEGNPKGDGEYHTWGIVKVETDAGRYGVGETYRGPEAMAVVTLQEESGPILEDGHVGVPDGPGLGVTIDPDGARDHLADGSDLVF